MKIIKYVIAYIVLILIFLGILTLAAMIPRKLISNNIERSLISFWKPTIYYRDIFDDSLVLDMSYKLNKKDPFISALEMNTLSNQKDSIDSMLEDYSPIKALTHEFNNDYFTDYTYNYSYARYWHGYVALMKPLLIFFTYNQMCGLLGVVSIILLIWFFVLMYKKISFKMACLFCIAWISIGYLYIWTSFSLFMTILLAIIFSIYILKNYNKIKNYRLLFFIYGSITVFMCWMNFTPITFAIPIMIYYLLNEENNFSIKEYFMMLFSYLFGYAIIWATKWILADVFTDNSIIRDSINQIVFRVMPGNMEWHDGSNHNVTIIGSILLNSYYYYFGTFAIIYLLYDFVFYNIFNKEKKILKKEEIMIWYLISLIPILVYALASNHSFLHASFFTNKNMVIFWLALIICHERKKEYVNENNKK